MSDSDAELEAELEAELTARMAPRTEAPSLLLTMLPEALLMHVLRHLPYSVRARARPPIPGHAHTRTSTGHLPRTATRAPSQHLFGAVRCCSRALAAAALAEASARATERLHSALEAGFASDGLGPQPRLGAMAAELEAALRALRPVARRKWASKYRQLTFTIRDPNNPEVRARLLAGELSAPDLCAQLVSGGSRELACSALQKQRDEWRRKHAIRRQRVRPDWRDQFTTVSGLHRCENCEGTVTRVHRTLRAGRMAVDRARTYATCVNCDERWEI